MKDNLLFRLFVFVVVLLSLFSVSRFFSWSNLDSLSRVNVFLSVFLLFFGLFVLFRFSRDSVDVPIKPKVDEELRGLREELHKPAPIVFDKPKIPVEPNVMPSSIPPIVKRQTEDVSMYSQERNTFKPVPQSSFKPVQQSDNVKKGEYEDLF